MQDRKLTALAEVLAYECTETDFCPNGSSDQCPFPKGTVCHDVTAEDWIGYAERESGEEQSPSALTWTHEPPTVPGLYLFRAIVGWKQFGYVSIINVESQLHEQSDVVQWAGPIPQPLEPSHDTK